METEALSTPESSVPDLQTVIFRLGSEAYGMEISRVNEIIRMKDITPIPGSAAHIKGLVNLRGRTIPVVDLRLRLMLPGVEVNEATRIIVVDSEHGSVGVIVDEVSEVLTLKSEQLEAKPDLVSAAQTDYVDRLAKQDDRIITLLNVDLALAA